MQGLTKFLGIITIGAVIAIGMTGCDNPTGGDDGNINSPKTLVIQNIPADVYSYGGSGGLIGIFQSGTSLQQALAQTGVVAGANLSNEDITVVGSGPYTMTVPLYKLDDSRWTGSGGPYDIYVALSGGEGHYYRAVSVNISSGTTYLPFNNWFREINGE
jgi:hypothetical protein